MAKLDVDIELIEKLADLMADKGLTELVVEEDDTKLRLQRGGGAPVYAAGPAPIAAAAPSAAVAATTAETASNHPGAIKAPMVGTAYLSPQPGAANFVSVGSKVAAGDTVLIIEAMKVMNQIPAPKAGTVTQILVADGEPVEFGEALLVIE
ncbi:MAG: acetyl-CoA carboxylase, biotin carboxyl carrier protein [Rhodospirillaceae bacterium]|jgi:acetyl-CoA carboxylase biotin carboxyl carrier protein|nr:acetyl-CoA carboxylase, biotin carboxyl carrier protein [Rhodospirillaceae bacterium]MAX60993.1 acetyl-CoA carboxylase, biotin carboxyl carrier protein [Rhodospirillaceae bacterium]MBB55731.1 acetyl-CoA carboxylase, biotin carboxyl carrier protein [Rhodospirillaceae bacterium]|tara:strand:+ start:212144 stop:212596 length:453 start_codon:yes stop_codon:yes gene_type:complete